LLALVTILSIPLLHPPLIDTVVDGDESQVEVSKGVGIVALVDFVPLFVVGYWGRDLGNWRYVRLEDSRYAGGILGFRMFLVFVDMAVGTSKLESRIRLAQDAIENPDSRSV